MTAFFISHFVSRFSSLSFNVRMLIFKRPFTIRGVTEHIFVYLFFGMGLPVQYA